MAEDLQENLSTYKLQLQQVEAALTNDPDNEDLNKLSNDLLEVINLTLELLSQNAKPKEEEAAIVASVPVPINTAKKPKVATDHSSFLKDSKQAQGPVSDWRVGDNCMALYSDDGQYYDAVIEEILDNGNCTVTFQSYGNSDLTQVNLLKKVEKSTEGGAPNHPVSKKDMIAQQREYKRKKQQKKQQRQKQQEEERETEKNKWLNFNTKTFSKTTKGKVKKSIFATTDEVQGKVGVGTCGTSGRPMTSYVHQEKWKKS